MNEPPEAKEKSPRLMHDILRDLPLRRAPATLESRVFGELQRRAARPWWRRRFTHWPPGARAAFVAICGGIIALTIRNGSWTMAAGALSGAGDLSRSWMHPAAAAIASAAELATLLMRAIPPTWLYGGLAVGATLYAALFGLGATAYRTLYLQPSRAGDLP